ncbi:MAG: hypothetical protein WDO17_23570 [Alphaproteobacteria bacterium]
MDEFTVNSTTTGDQDQPSVAGLQGTQFVAVWRNASTQEIRGRLFGVNGAASSNEFNIALPQEAGTKRQLPTVVETTRGFAVAWIQQLPGSVPQLKVRGFDADTLSGEETQASSAEVEPLVRPALARLSDGGFVVVWADKRKDERIRTQRYDLDAMKSGAEFRANTIPELHRFPMAAGLTSGNFVIGWRARSAAPLLAHFQMFNPGGAPIGGEQTTTLDVTETAMTPLDTGRFVIAHIRQPFDGETGFDTTFPQAALFEANGTDTNLHFTGTSAQRIQSSSLAIAPVSGGRFLLAWSQTNTDNAAAGSNVATRLFTGAGAFGNVAQVNTRTGGNRFSVAAATTFGPDGDTGFLVWVDDGAADQSGRAIQGRVMPIAAAGF